MQESIVKTVCNPHFRDLVAKLDQQNILLISDDYIHMMNYSGEPRVPRFSFISGKKKCARDWSLKWAGKAQGNSNGEVYVAPVLKKTKSRKRKQTPDTEPKKYKKAPAEEVVVSKSDNSGVDEPDGGFP
ncbi:hypothetical protein CAPTEDRAFT_203952 [Capitella teleta]|uniref:Uncharacterized protein n=1 Tax=Capitella teleta TaxID=283909 RepID=R7TEW1_CAPTE|nr:hypothetical protein CAPTEDRAFT_203952 [Capitella teleta]|eukprot:ELT92288.1 hypothetical protein CAPTEDRAFT_203952 [Capitella teleta]